MNFPIAQDDARLQPLVTRSRLGVVTDVDGTISPIVDVPDAAQVTPQNRALLRQLQDVAVLVAAVSGRSAADIQRRVGVPGVVYVGNHGLERWEDGSVQVQEAVKPYLPALNAIRAQIDPIPGMLLEDKGATLSLHYRQTDAPEKAAATMRPMLQKLVAQHGLKLTEGRMVFEIRPPLDVHKGTALRWLVARYALDALVFLGDDTTDADAMQVAREMREQGACYGIAVGVMGAETPQAVRDHADVLVDGVLGVEAFLAWLFQARMASST